MPQSALVPHNALVPQRAFVPQSALVPHRALVPQSALDPHRALVPHNAFEPDTGVEEVPTRNCADPHTAALDHVPELFQTEEGSSFRKTLPELLSYAAIGDIAVPLAVSELLSAASISTLKRLWEKSAGARA